VWLGRKLNLTESLDVYDEFLGMGRLQVSDDPLPGEVLVARG
jgi:hypothetical protein